MLVGYARTSTADQIAGLDAQARELNAAGCTKLIECLAFLREGDTLIVTKPDRLARTTAELLRIEADLTTRGIGLVIQSMGLDTRNGSNPTARLLLSTYVTPLTTSRMLTVRLPPGAGRGGESLGSISQRCVSCWLYRTNPNQRTLRQSLPCRSGRLR
jgi:hypothetical protein